MKIIKNTNFSFFKKACLIISFLSFSSSIFGQKIDTVFTLKNGSVDTYYLTLIPERPSKGLLVILGGFSFPTETIMETNLPKKAVESGFTVLLPFVYRADTVDNENIFQTRLEQLIPKVIKKNNIPENKFIIGGQSWAGHQALLYAERAYNPDYHGIVKPNAVFGVDPPLDLKRLYNGYQRSMSFDTTKVKNQEAVMITSLFEKQFGGNPLQKPKQYELASSFYREAKDGGNAKYLKTVPVRLYSDPDINWYITQRNSPIEWQNLADITAMIVQLRLLGNKNAEYISCLGKGFLTNGQRHPHSFSMLDSDDFIIWANKILEGK